MDGVAPRQRGGRATVVASRLLSMALGIPVYFVDDAPELPKRRDAWHFTLGDLDFF